MIKIGTLFSGIGAIEEALKKLDINYKIIFAADNGERDCDFDVEKVKSEISGLSIKEKNEYIEELYLKCSKKENKMQKQYLANFKVPEGHYYQDVRFLNGDDYKKEKLDLLVGGSPCQSFSIIGKRGGLEDTRGTLFYEYARIVKQAEPKVFIYENVVGMLNHDHGKTWDTILNVFNSLGYNIKYFVLNAKDYGIPQDRKRIFVIGSLNNNNMETPPQIELKTTVKDYLDKKSNFIFYLGKKGFEFTTNPKYKNRARVNKDIMMCQKANQQFNWNGDFVFEKFDEKIHDLNIQNRGYLGDYNGEKGYIRQLSPRECLRLMGFSENYIVAVDNHNAWRQAGNAIVVNVLEAILKEMIDKGLLNVKGSEYI